METMGSINIARTISAFIEFMKPYGLENDWVDNMSDSTYNFFIGYEFADDRKNKIALSETSRALIKNQFNNYIHQLDELSEKIWDYGCSDNEGWGYPIRLLNKIVEQKIFK